MPLHFNLISRDYIRYSFGKDERCWSSNL